MSGLQRRHSFPATFGTLDKSGHGSSPFSNAAPVTPCRYDSRAKSGECRGGAASHSAVKKPTLAGRFDGEN
ncbi:hypothetical protein CPV32_22150 [Salmonella enterica]|nr:hypothetical protein [Salmonella enterica]EBR9573402.1 hypothetical protein [Salmonella enterica subsp. enterica serovar Sandiego]EBA1115574.1 hypothetical protein [Salmonella enterica]EBB6644849.1 hypothetical protein [Salmonella enterica]EBI9510030.1 hypothetical protein [Salmonella enterica]